MSDHSSIEWTDATWNPVTGCTKVSPGCDNCYAERVTNRWKPGSFDTVTLHPDRLDKPLRWRKPRRVFVNSMSDLFHDDVPDEFIARAWATMAEAPQHTFQILTKRHARMRSLLNREDFVRLVDKAVCEIQDHFDVRLLEDNDWMARWPLPNVWLGVSVEDQRWARIRIPHLLDTPAAVRFLSCEPLVGYIDLTNLTLVEPEPPHGPGAYLDALRGHLKGPDDMLPARIDWVIVGGESGPAHRPIKARWVRDLRDQCNNAGTAFFFKQWGGSTPKSGGRHLDGREWSEYPKEAVDA